MFAPPTPLCLPACPSTNDAAWAGLEAGIYGHGQLIYTPYQTAGRGQRGAGWHSAPGQNLLCSTVLFLGDKLEAGLLFDLSRAVALAVVAAVEVWTGGAVRPLLKWPNDIWAGGRKLGGILIENRWAGPQPEWAVVGLGLNVRQVVFAEGLPATSLQLLTGQTYSVAEGAAHMCHFVANCMDAFVDIQVLRQAYDARLLGLGQTVLLAEPSQPPFWGTILGTTEAGLLSVATPNGTKPYDLKEIEQRFAMLG